MPIADLAAVVSQASSTSQTRLSIEISSSSCFSGRPAGTRPVGKAVPEEAPKWTVTGRCGVDGCAGNSPSDSGDTKSGGSMRNGS